ncbi:hypothetical protein AVEN_121295-1 [Araneus ventricosus]|uniref:Uncharacterized protein n=1 Tax=Araneus ventricosus TaxID=182803 RepID=A0A4Y2HKQ2_ARAVE|nr:hypothetical protein AVEN_121295-1 [Araneus ventricosus]
MSVMRKEVAFAIEEGVAYAKGGGHRGFFVSELSKRYGYTVLSAQHRTPPHAPAPDAITATEPVGWTWDSAQNRFIEIIIYTYKTLTCVAQKRG